MVFSLSLVQNSAYPAYCHCITLRQNKTPESAHFALSPDVIYTDLDFVPHAYAAEFSVICKFFLIVIPLLILFMILSGSPKSHKELPAVQAW